ncbi:MAG TPA: hypothetical protein VHG28_19710 [Longimicrobiaceae bacterium]|nr:hypothetical protein [Longimicrobiaceae bacterium]
MLPRKGSRRIVVDGQPYRWLVRRSPTYAQANAWTGLSFAVQHADTPGAVLQVRVPAARPDNSMGAKGGVITPSDVARAVRLALAEGWRPEAPGGPYQLTLHSPVEP